MISVRTTRTLWVATLLGAALFTALAVAQGLDPVAAALAEAGFRILWLVPLFAVPLGLTTVAWRLLFRVTDAPSWRTLAYGHWLGFAANQLLPTARVGGELARAQVALRARVPGPAVVASLVADKTAQVASVAAVGALGLGLLAQHVAQTEWVVLGWTGAALTALSGLAFYVAQRKGLVRWSGRWTARLLPAQKQDDWKSQAAETEDRLLELYGGLRVPATAALHVLFRVALAYEVHLLAGWLGHPITFVDALILEGTNQLLRAASFLVPGALGVQESGFVVLGELLGVPAPVAFSVSLGKRAREILVGVPALVVWQVAEGRRLIPGRPAPREAGPDQ